MLVVTNKVDGSGFVTEPSTSSCSEGVDFTEESASIDDNTSQRTYELTVPEVSENSELNCDYEVSDVAGNTATASVGIFVVPPSSFAPTILVPVILDIASSAAQQAEIVAIDQTPLSTLPVISSCTAGVSFMLQSSDPDNIGNATQTSATYLLTAPSVTENTPYQCNAAATDQEGLTGMASFNCTILAPSTEDFDAAVTRAFIEVFWGTQLTLNQTRIQPEAETSSIPYHGGQYSKNSIVLMLFFYRLKTVHV
jgi:hypothetical protein